jgi:HTH-type transcriptional regulator / antitoxin HipB
LVIGRVEAGITQRQLADRLGVKQTAVARWEAGDTLPTLDTLFRVAKVLQLDFTVTPDVPLTVSPHHRPEARLSVG